ncbi:MAG: hypothetical protein KDA60_00400 [Planctomycetales bacterium]|nr:hypothetical protein [Planctomycetales bacterium]
MTVMFLVLGVIGFTLFCAFIVGLLLASARDTRSIGAALLLLVGFVMFIGLITVGGAVSFTKTAVRVERSASLSDSYAPREVHEFDSYGADSYTIPANAPHASETEITLDDEPAALVGPSANATEATTAGEGPVDQDAGNAGEASPDIPAPAVNNTVSPEAATEFAAESAPDAKIAAETANDAEIANDVGSVPTATSDAVDTTTEEATQAVADLDPAPATTDEEIDTDEPTETASLIGEENTLLLSSRDVSPRPRPAWLDEDSRRTGPTHRVVIDCGPYSSENECREALAEQAHEACSEYARWYLREHLGRRVTARQLAAMELSVPAPWSEDAEYWEVRDHGGEVGRMYTLHVLAEYDESARQQIEDRWRETKSVERLAATGVSSAMALGLLTAVFGALRLKSQRRVE